MEHCSSLMTAASASNQFLLDSVESKVQQVLLLSCVMKLKHKNCCSHITDRWVVTVFLLLTSVWILLLSKFCSSSAHPDAHVLPVIPSFNFHNPGLSPNSTVCAYFLPLCVTAFLRCFDCSFPSLVVIGFIVHKQGILQYGTDLLQKDGVACYTSRTTSAWK